MHSYRCDLAPLRDGRFALLTGAADVPDRQLRARPMAAPARARLGLLGGAAIVVLSTLAAPAAPGVRGPRAPEAAVPAQPAEPDLAGAETR